MKKLFVSLFSVVLFVFSIVGFTACGNNNSLPDLADCEIGYQLPVYPTCEFDYKYNDEYIVHIDSITVTLVEKNTIEEGDILDEKFSPYYAEWIVKGSTDATLAGKDIFIELHTTEDGKSTSTSYSGSIESDGTFNVKYKQAIYKNSIWYFHEVSLISDPLE